MYTPFTGKSNLTGFLVFLLLISSYPSHGQFRFGVVPNDFTLTSGTTKSMNPRCDIFSSDSLSFGKRFLYSNLIMLTSSAAGYTYLYLRYPENNNFFKKYDFFTLKKSFTLWPMWDTDHWSYNFAAHPYMGSLTYLASRNRGGNIIQSFLISSANSFMHEYLLASGTQRPSYTDLITTPIGGLILGESIFRVKRILVRDHYLSFTEKALITLLDPYEVVRKKFRYSELVH